MSKLRNISMADLKLEHVSTLAVVSRMIASELETRVIDLAEKLRKKGASK